jgi:hypothetical protein
MNQTSDVKTKLQIPTNLRSNKTAHIKKNKKLHGPQNV